MYRKSFFYPQQNPSQSNTIHGTYHTSPNSICILCMRKIKCPEPWITILYISPLFVVALLVSLTLMRATDIIYTYSWIVIIIFRMAWNLGLLFLASLLSKYSFLEMFIKYFFGRILSKLHLKHFN